ncbi:putative TIR domain, winged helix-turn-helix DNA-binding domain-containing protein [Rosa chinensis]|uniref:ADP-ribosyl cyclase/cyclic ADP-ribose hydrolase n=1 Tax=Rosa chinensis TaxID=74649 RepID=A0A2P6Q8R8_ROSCH|nr:putative TIR domain, winged helix-turn-helix DNA-binding domain-containing protein [Rosa chinensis]
MAAASSSSDIIPREKYDVFLSFRGEDTRNTFTSHLYAALCQEKILTYKDDEELQRGDDISPALLKAISESKLSVIIFSKDYASSTWCLDELVHILRCRGEQFVIPIFYGIDPSHVRKQSGSYADAFVKHEERFKDTMDKVLRWRHALTTAANISGFDSEKIRPDSDLVKRVVNDILVKLDGKSQNAGGLERWVGMDKHIIQLVELLCLNSRDVHIVGIWGMGGIGKTTIADVVFHRLSFEFEACCFINHVREASETKHGLLYDLRNDLFRTLLKDEKIRITTPSIGSSFMRERLRRTKALIVLDDVSEFSQLKFLAGGDFNLFGPGSRILVTTRDKRIFRKGVDDDKIYEVQELDVDEALELFHLRANVSFPGDYTTFAKQVVDYAGGNPLALTTLGSVFSHCWSKEDWEGELEKVKKIPNRNIQQVLRLSYDRLEENEQDIFLDIACYYKGEDIDYTERMLDASGFCANAGIRLLIDMSLISVDKCSRFIKMHDLIQEMGHKIIRDQDAKNPGKRSRLWTADDVCRVLKENRGTEAIECLGMSMDHISDLDIKPSAFKKMVNLRLLRLQFERYSYWDSKSWVNKVHLPQGLKCLPQALRILHWDGYPLNSLPSKFRPENLVELHMQGSRLERLWDKGLKINLGSLKRMYLRLSKHLAEVPDLSESPKLESIDLERCTSLVQLPSSFQHLAKLTWLSLDDCSNLKILPEMPGNLEVLKLDGTAIEELPSSIWCLEKLRYLGLGSCKELKNIPSSTCRLNSLRCLRLRLSGCLSLEELPSGLTSLDLRGCESLGSLPVELPSGLKDLFLGYCKSLGSLPDELPSGLTTLDLMDCESLGSLPVELPSGLSYLYMRNCKSLKSLPVELPSGLRELSLRGCESLGSLPVKLPSGVTSLDLRGCESLESLPKLPWLLMEKCLFINCVKLDQISCPGNEIPKWMRYRRKGHKINIKLPPHPFRQGFLGYALCIVVAFNNYTPPPINIGPTYFICGTHHKTNNGHKDRCDLDIRLPDDIILNSDHWFLWYFCPNFVRFGSTINREDWVKASEASFNFMLYQDTGPKEIPFDLSTVRVKRCGVSLMYAQDFEKLVRGIDEDVVMEPKQVVEEEDIIIKTKRRRDHSDPGGRGIAIFKEEDDSELLSETSKRKINIM